MNMIETGEKYERAATVISALNVIAHTTRVDPEFMQKCVAAMASEKPASPGFGSMLEQHEGEFRSLLEHVKGCRSALEIGSRYGMSIKRISDAMQPYSRIVAVDMPYTGGYGDLPASEPILRKIVKGIGDAGHEAHLFLGNSHAPSVVAAVQALGPYDFCFIDGDHSYDGVKADWENFGPHAKVVAFHDIINNVDCFRLWNEIKGGYRHVEYTASVWLGIGVLFKDN